MGKKTCYFGGILSVFGYLGTWFGFTQSGVAAGSFAALIQSFIGNVTSNSLFATLTSWGMRGYFSYFSNIGLVIFVYGLVSSFFKEEKPKKETTLFGKTKEKVYSLFSKPKPKRGFFDSLFGS